MNRKAFYLDTMVGKNAYFVFETLILASSLLIIIMDQ
jgi:hypothetical protein